MITINYILLYYINHDHYLLITINHCYNLSYVLLNQTIYYLYMAVNESRLCMEHSAVFWTYGTKGLRNWSCSGPLECDQI